jgi:divalent metal cation (Fe/Co/Zn/Cd) transporter
LFEMKELLFAIITIVLLTLLTNPFTLWMPTMATMMVTLALVVAFGIFASFVWRERARDEREVLHRMLANRVAYLAGSAVLVIGIAMESFIYHMVDPFLTLALGAMIIAKLISSIYNNVHR